MGWFVREKRGEGVSWKDQTLDSLSLPPSPLLLFFLLFLMFISIATYSELKGRMERGIMAFRLPLLLLLPLIAVAVLMLGSCSRWRRLDAAGGLPPLGLAAAVVVLLVLAYHQSSFQSGWFRSI
ncbi:uncharacterized protein LOC127257216 [Andrographis paniculata]|uniref:uncharacterized protein LOC127257216 n=1 Tax=Andrographis paniculata TaxID=175694 RepID=UPI0021E7E9CD|nr:uncharacterized protein LOC127257216 [Andrographis paniculata]